MKRAVRSKVRRKATPKRATRKKAPAKSAKAAKRPKTRAVARKPAAKKKAQRRVAKPARLKVETLSPPPSLPPPPPEDATEVSGVWGRVLVSENDPYQEVREIFNHYDRDKSGLIESREFARICEALGIEMDDEELAIGLSIVDADNDGRISWNDFLSWWRSIRG